MWLGFTLGHFEPQGPTIKSKEFYPISASYIPNSAKCQEKYLSIRSNITQSTKAIPLSDSLSSQMSKVQLVSFCQFNIKMSVFLRFNTYLLLLCSHSCLNLCRMLTVSFCFSQYHDVQLKLCGGGRWELTKLKGGSGSLSLREEATWLQSYLFEILDMLEASVRETRTENTPKFLSY